MVFSMQNNRRGLEFQASTIETIDAAIHNYIKELNLHAATTKALYQFQLYGLEQKERINLRTI